MIVSRWKKLTEDSMFRNVIILVFGTATAQAIPILYTHILTRIYSVGEYGTFGIILTILTLSVVFITAKLELAINIPYLDKHAKLIMLTALLITIFFSFVLLIIVYLNLNRFNIYIGLEENSKLTLFIPLAVCYMGVGQIMRYWLNRKKLFKDISRNNVLQSLISSNAQLLFGGLIKWSNGLVAGQLLGHLVSTIYLVRVVIKRESIKIGFKTLLIEFKTLLKIRYILRRYKRFPLFLLPAQLINNVVQFLPLILLNNSYSVVLVGYYLLTQRMFAIPILLVSTSIGDVFRQAASEQFVKNGNCESLFITVFKKLLFISALPFLILYFTAPWLFGFVFGAEWQKSGEIAQILAPMFFLQFVSSPLSYMFVIAEKQNLDLIWNIFFLLVVSAGFFLGERFGDIDTTLFCVSVAYSLMYLSNLLMSYRFSKGKFG